MSFAFLPFYTGDYLRDTGHLSPREHGVYILMLVWCWQREQPLPLDVERIYRIVHAVTKDDEQAVGFVLSEFWKKSRDGYHNPRIEKELARSNGISSRGKAGAAGRWANHAKHYAKPMPNQCIDDCQTDPKSMVPTTTTTPIPTTTPNPKDLGGDPLLSITSSPPPAPVVVVIPLTKNQEWPCPTGFLAELESAYPDVAGVATLREIRAWFISHPKKRLDDGEDVMGFINAWFERTQNA